MDKTHCGEVTSVRGRSYSCQAPPGHLAVGVGHVYRDETMELTWIDSSPEGPSLEARRVAALERMALAQTVTALAGMVSDTGSHGYIPSPDGAPEDFAAHRYRALSAATQALCDHVTQRVVARHVVGRVVRYTMADGTVCVTDKDRNLVPYVEPKAGES